MARALTPNIRRALLATLESERIVMRQMALFLNDETETTSFNLRKEIVSYIDGPGSDKFERLICADRMTVKRAVFDTIRERGRQLVDFLSHYTGESWFNVADEVNLCGGGNLNATEANMILTERKAAKTHQAHYALGTVAEHVKRTENQETA